MVITPSVVIEAVTPGASADIMEYTTSQFLHAVAMFNSAKSMTAVSPQGVGASSH